MLVWQAWHFVLHLLQRLRCLGVERRKNPKGLKGWEPGEGLEGISVSKRRQLFDEVCKIQSECLIVVQSRW